MEEVRTEMEWEKRELKEVRRNMWKMVVIAASLMVLAWATMLSTAQGQPTPPEYPVSTLMNIDAHNNNGIVKVVWKSKENSTEGHFLLERRDKNGTWVVGKKMLHEGSVNKAVQYTITDPDAPLGTCAYRVYRFYEDGSYYKSWETRVRVKKDAEEIALK